MALLAVYGHRLICMRGGLDSYSSMSKSYSLQTVCAGFRGMMARSYEMKLIGSMDESDILGIGDIWQALVKRGKRVSPMQ